MTADNPGKGFEDFHKLDRATRDELVRIVTAAVEEEREAILTMIQESGGTCLCSMWSGESCGECASDGWGSKSRKLAAAIRARKEEG